MERILRIPLSDNMNEDFIAWHHIKSYTFTVRSAYYVEWNHQHGQNLRRGDGQGYSSTNPVWEITWKLNLPSKINIFLWKALHGVIPGLSVLANRHIKVNPQRPICMGGAKDMRHLMFTCRRAKDVWRSLGLGDYQECPGC